MKQLVTTAVGALVVFAGLLAPSSGRGQGGDKKVDGKVLDNLYYPLTIGTTWEYSSGGKKVVVKVAAHEMVDGMTCARLETDSGAGMVTEHVTVKANGIYRVKAKDQDIKPHLLILQLPPKKGDSWAVDSMVQNFAIKGKLTVGEENLKIGKDDYSTFSVKSSDLMMDGKGVTLEVWYAKDVGMVKQHFSLPAANLDVVLELNSFTKGK